MRLCSWTMREKRKLLQVKAGRETVEMSNRTRIQLLGNKGMLKVCYSDHLDGLQSLQHSSVLEKADVHVSPSSLTYLFLGRLRGLSYGAGHVCSWGWRPCNANPSPQLRKVPCLPVQNENNKELSVAAASGVQCTHQNMSKSHSLLLPPTHLSMHDSPSRSCFFSLTLFSTCERHGRLQTTM